MSENKSPCPHKHTSENDHRKDIIEGLRNSYLKETGFVDRDKYTYWLENKIADFRSVTDEGTERPAETFHPGQQYQRLFNAIAEAGSTPLISQMDDVIRIVKEDFGGIEEQAGVTVEEFIICAANYYDDGEKHLHQPKNITTGFVVCGRRHHNCINIFAMIVGFPYNEKANAIHRTEAQGFLTNTNRFVYRKEAYTIAFNANQIKGPNKGQQENSIGLTSEDLY